MFIRFSHFFTILVVSSAIVAGCKTSPTGPTTVQHIDIGDTIPNKFSLFSYTKWQLDASGVVNQTTVENYGSTTVDSTGMTYMGKSNVYFLRDDGPDAGSNGDSVFISYEPSSDVSIYFQNPGFIKNYSHANQVDETLDTILNYVFHQWVRLPIATKDTNVTIYSSQSSQQVYVSGTLYPVKITARVDYVGDSTLHTGSIDLAAKHCRLSVNADISLVVDQLKVSHVRDIWFVPKIGYIAAEKVKTNVPANVTLDIPLDTTSTLKLLSSFLLK